MSEIVMKSKILIKIYFKDDRIFSIARDNFPLKVTKINVSDPLKLKKCFSMDSCIQVKKFTIKADMLNGNPDFLTRNLSSKVPDFRYDNHHNLIRNENS